MKRKYIHVRPSRERVNPDDIVSHLSSLQKLKSLDSGGGITDKINPLRDDGPSVPRFEFLAVSRGRDAPVEFYYGVDEDHLETLRNRLVTAYPESFTVEPAEVDLLETIVPPVEYDPESFVNNLVDGKLQYDADDVPGTVTDLTGSHQGTTDLEKKTEDAEQEETPLTTAETSPETSESDTESEANDEPGTSPDPTKFGDDVDEDVIEDAEPLAELNGEVLKDIAPPDALEGNAPVTAIDGPTKTEDGNVLARPTLEHGEPVAARWFGDGDRKKDWMTTMKMFSNVAEPEADDLQSRAPLAMLVQHLSECDLPIAFQVTFERMDNWTKMAEKRKDDLHLDRDTLGQKVVYELGEIIHESSEERRQEKRRDYFDDMGETAGGEDSVVGGDIGDRKQLIDMKNPKSTFKANIRAISIATGEISVDEVKGTMKDLAAVLDHLDGYFYGLSPKIVEDTSGMIGDKPKATKEFHRLLNRDLETGSGKKRPGIVVNADELANFVSVPSSANLTVEGVRGTRAEAESRDPLPRPDPDLMEKFHKPGMRVGYALDEEAQPEDVPTQLPASMLTKHFGRFATTGAGKSKALINDMMSLYENTDGPIVFIDPKGDGMTQNYLRTHFERFGEKDLRENVIHFPVPEILPGFTFFNIRPALGQGQRRVDAIQNKADHYEELLKLVMGAERYRESKVAPTIIKALIKSLFDAEHGADQYTNSSIETDRERESSNYYSHDDLEHAAEELRKHVAVEDDEEGSVPEVEDDRIHRTLTRHTESDPQDFATIMNAVFNRLDYIREDTHLRKIFDNTEDRFDFRDHLNEKKVILFDLGDLRDDATVIMTGLILMDLWDALKEHDRTSCDQGHADREACESHARDQGANPDYPPCRSPWDDNHLVNLIIDEAASVAVSDIMNKMLEQGRSFHLSIGLSMQYPEQMKEAGDRTYRNVLNNVASLLIGKITLDEEIAKAMAHEDMTPEQFSNRIKSLPRGEWIAQLPSPTFKETGPEPFSLDPLPIPSGHPESNNPLGDAGEEHFQHMMDNVIHDRTRNQYGVPQSSYDSQPATDNTEDRGGGTDHDGSSDDHDGSGGMLDGEGASDVAKPDVEGTVTDSSMYAEAGQNLPERLTFRENVYVCKCGSEFLRGNREEAFRCCGEPEDEAEDESETTTDTDGEDTDENGGHAEQATEEKTSADSDDSVNGEQDTTSQYGNGSSDQTKQDESAYPNSSTGTPEGGVSAVGGGGTGQGGTQAQQASSGPSSTSQQQQVQQDDPGDKGNPIFDVGHSNLNGDPGSYDPSHVNDSVDITGRESLREALIEWNRSSVIAVGITICEALYDDYPDLCEEILVDLTSEASSNYIRFDSEEASFTAQNIIDVYTGNLNFDGTANDVEKAPLSKEYNPDDDDDPDSGGETTDSSTKTPDTTDEGDEYTVSANTSYTQTDGSDTDRFGQGEGVDYATPKPQIASASPVPAQKRNTQEKGNPAPELVFGRPETGESDESNLTWGELRFLATVAKVMNGEANFDRTESLEIVRDKLQEKHEIDIEKLEREGYIQKHRLGKQNTLTYTVTKKGLDECGKTLSWGPGVGDIGGDMPHRYGTDLTVEWLRRLPGLEKVGTFQSTNGGEDEEGEDVDVFATNQDDDVSVVVEVEAGRTGDEAANSVDKRAGTNNYGSIQKDAELMAGVLRGEDGVGAEEGAAIWVVRSMDVAIRVARALASGGLIDLDSDEVARRYARMSMADFNEEVLGKHGGPGVDAIYTFSALEEVLPDHITESDF